MQPPRLQLMLQVHDNSNPNNSIIKFDDNENIFKNSEINHFDNSRNKEN